MADETDETAATATTTATAATSETAPTYEGVRDSILEARKELERVNNIVREILTRKRTYTVRDAKDQSIHPSYTNFKVPYPRVCWSRYRDNKINLEATLHREMDDLLTYQPTAYDAARLARHLAITSLWPPLHNRRDIESFKKNFFQLTYKQKSRLEYIMNHEFN